MLPYSRPSKRTKRVLARDSASKASVPPSSIVQEFLQAQQLDTAPENDELESPDSAEVDEGEFEHDTLVTQESVVNAIEQLHALCKVVPTKQQLRNAQGIMTKVRIVKIIFISGL